jgi:ribosome-binding protein aMBF1 (putative translation factor)
MVKKEFCDMCGKEASVEGEFIPLKLADATLADLCYTCRNALVNSIHARRQEIEAASKSLFPKGAPVAPSQGKQQQPAQKVAASTNTQTTPGGVY